MKQATMNLQNSDCFDFLKNIQNESIDHIIIDPPYGVLSGHKIETQIDIPQLFTELFRVLKPDSFCVFFGMYPTLPRWSIAAEDCGLKWDNHICWAKRTITSPYLALQRSHEEILIFKKGQPKYNDTYAQMHDLKVPALWHGIYDLQTMHTLISDLYRRINEPEYNALYYSGMPTSNGSDEANDVWYQKKYKQSKNSPKRTNSKENILKTIDASVTNDKLYTDRYPNTASFRYRSKEYCNLTNTWSFVPQTLWDLLSPEIRQSLLSNDNLDLNLAFESLWSFLPENQTSFTSKKKEGINIKHPTVKPLKLMKRLVELVSTEGQTILDCFSGSGSTAVACLETGRNFIGCELDTSYHADSLVRLERAREALQTPKEPMQPTLF